MDGVETPGGVIQLALPNNSVAFDSDAFDLAVEAHGPVLEHWRAMKSPLGLIDKFDSRRPDETHGVIGGEAESGGMIFTKAGCVSALFTSNSKDLRTFDGGYLSNATAQITPARFYKNGDPVYMAPFDRLFVEDCSVLVTHQQLVEAHATGRDRLNFLAVQVQDVVDASGVRYNAGADFDVVGGQIVWKGTNRPGTDPNSEIGKIYAVRYLYRPFWVVDSLMREIRLAQTENPFTGERKTVRMPITVRVQREYVFLSENKDPQASNPDSPRQVPGPRDGQLGPR
jgi:hypothetical protein